jgi:hypothetical protein
MNATTAVRDAPHHIEFLISHLVIILALCSLVIVVTFLSFLHARLRPWKISNLLFMLIVDVNVLNVLVVVFSIIFDAVLMIFPDAPMVTFFTDSFERFFWNGAFYVDLAAVCMAVPFAFIYSEAKIGGAQIVQSPTILKRGYQQRKSVLRPAIEAVCTVVLLNSMIYLLVQWVRVPLLSTAMHVGAFLHLLCVCRGFVTMSANMIKLMTPLNLTLLRSSSSAAVYHNPVSNTLSNKLKLSRSPMSPTLDYLRALSESHRQWRTVIEGMHLRSVEDVKSLDVAAACRLLDKAARKESHMAKARGLASTNYSDMLLRRTDSASDAHEEHVQSVRDLIAEASKISARPSPYLSPLSRKASTPRIPLRVRHSYVKSLLLALTVRARQLIYSVLLFASVGMWILATERILLGIFGFRDVLTPVLLSYFSRLSKPAVSAVLDVLLVASFTTASFLGIIDFPIIGLRSFSGWVVEEVDDSHDAKSKKSKTVSWSLAMCCGTLTLSIMALSLPTVVTQLGILSSNFDTNLPAWQSESGLSGARIYLTPAFIAGFTWSMVRVLRGIRNLLFPKTQFPF